MASSPDSKSAARSLALRSVLWLALAAGIVVVAIRYGADRVTGYASVGALIMATSPFAPRLKAVWGSRAEPSTAEQICEAARLLRKLVADKWQPSAEFLRIGRIEDSMAIAWQDTERRAHGPISSLIDDYRDDPRPLIVLGGQGAGKTALSILLLLELLSHGQGRDDGRIPVLVRLSPWDPDLDVEAWLVRAVYEQYDIYRQLRDTSRYGSDVVARLLADGRLLPILDGLDELPPQAARKVVTQVRAARMFTAPFVLTSRVAEYEYAVDRKPPRGKQTVRLLPMSSASVADYVQNLFSGDLERWQPILDEIAADPDGIVAATLSNPLMLYLASTHFYDSGTDPTALLDRHAHHTAEELQHYLLDSFVPAVFAARAAPRGQDTRHQPWRLGPERANRSLSYLARYLEARRGSGGSHGAEDLAWWELYRTVPGYLLVLIPAVIGTLGCGLLGRVAFGLFGRAGVGTVFGLAVGCAGGAVLGMIRPRPPVQFVPSSLRQKTASRRLLLMDAILGTIGAVAGGVISGVIVSPVYGVVSGLVWGVTFGAVRRFTRPTEPKRGISPVDALRADRDAVIYAFLLGALIGAVIGAINGVTPELAGRLVYQVGRPERGLIGAGVGAVLGSAGLGMVMTATSAWAHFVTARVWLAVTGKTPYRLIRFLEDACELGVLRRVGAGYQFRHALLQEQLAREERAEGAGASG
jgi:hypothetical protein